MRNELLVQIRQTEQSDSTKVLLKSFILALFVAINSILLCQTLINSGKNLETTEKHNFKVDLIRLDRKEPRSKRPVKPVKPPDRPPLEKVITSSLAIPKILVSTPSDFQSLAPTSPNVELNGMITGDGNYFPRIKIPPVYPVRARNMGIEGFCTVKYTITKYGKVENVVPVSRECQNLFKISSIDAAKKFLYKPRIINGEAVDVNNVKNKFIYRLQQND